MRRTEGHHSMEACRCTECRRIMWYEQQREHMGFHPTRTENISFLDGDGAGKHSVGVNVIYLSEKVRLDGVFVIKMPDGMDPYDVVTQCGAEALRELKERAVPAVQWMVESSEPQQVLGLYLSCPEWYRMTVLKEICKIKCFSLSETESWLRSLHKESSMKKQEESDEQMDEKSELLKLVNGQKSSLNMDVNKAIRILKMRYGVDVE